MKPLRSFALLVFRLAAFALLSGTFAPACAHAVGIGYQAFDLDDASGPGGDFWSYEYTVSDPGAVLAVDTGFSIYFPPAFYSDLELPPAVVLADWDVITLQPAPGLPADGLYDALSLSNTPSLAGPFRVHFIWLGAPGTHPGAQPFDVNEFDAGGNFVSTLQSGMTVPEPATAGFLAAAWALMVAGRRRTRWIALALSFICVAPSSVSAQGAGDIVLEEIEKVSERRVMRTVFEYTFRARVRNDGATRHRDVRAMIIPNAAGITITDDTVEFGTMVAGATAISTDTFVFQFDRTQPFDPASLPFFFTVAPPAAPVLTNLRAPLTAARGTTMPVTFDFADADGDIVVTTLSRNDALKQATADLDNSFTGVTGESGSATLNFDTSVLPFGAAEFSLQLRDAGGLLSSTVSFAVNVTGEANTGSAPSVVRFSPVAGSYDRPTGPYDLAQIRFEMEVADPDNDLEWIRVRTTDPFELQTVTEQPATEFALPPSGGQAASSMLAFGSTSPLGDYTVQVTPFDHNGHAGTPASATVALVNDGGEVRRLAVSAPSPDNGAPGTEVDIFSSGFISAPDAQTVIELNEVPCEIVSLTGNVVRVRVPVGTHTGALIARNPDGSSAISAQNLTVPDHVVISPDAEDGPPLVPVDATVSFTSRTGTALADKSVTWLVNGIAGGNGALGTISAAGVYTAPAAVPAPATVEITAALTANAAAVSAPTPVTIVPPPATPGGARILAAVGGTVSSADFRSQVHIPAGALAANTTISTRTLTPAELPAAGPGLRTLGAVEFGPPGTTFNSPVTVTIPLIVAQPPGTSLPLRFYQPGGGNFVDEGITATVNASGNAAVAMIPHFTTATVHGPDTAPGPGSPTITSIQPSEIEEAARQPIKLFGTGLTADLRVELRKTDGTPATTMTPGTLVVAGDRAGFVLDPGVIENFDTGTREFRLRLVRSSDAALFAEIPFTVSGLPEFDVSGFPSYTDPGPMRVSRVSIHARARLKLHSGVLNIDAVGGVEIHGVIDASGHHGNNAVGIRGGEGRIAASSFQYTGGDGGRGRREGATDNYYRPVPQTYGEHGNDPYGFPNVRIQGPARPLDAAHPVPAGLGGEPGDSHAFSNFEVPSVQEMRARFLSLRSIYPAGRRGLGAPANVNINVQRCSGGGGGGGGLYSYSGALNLVCVDYFGGGGGAGGDGGCNVRIRTARSFTGSNASDPAAPIVDARGGNGGDGSQTSGFRRSAIFGTVVYAGNSSDGESCLIGGGGGGGRTGAIEVSAAEGLFVTSETECLKVGGGRGGNGGQTDIDADNRWFTEGYGRNAASDAEPVRRARQVFSPLFSPGTSTPQVFTRALLRWQSPRTVAGTAKSFHVLGELPGQDLTVLATHNGATGRYEATLLLFPGFNKIADPNISFRDPLNAPRFLNLGIDTDGDGLTVEDEAEFGTDPNLADTDGDGPGDGTEVLAGTNPLAPPAGRPDVAFAPELLSSSGGKINSVAVQADGKILIGGDFLFVRAQARTRIARLNPDGTLEGTATFNSGFGANGEVFSVVVQTDGKILIGGDFSNVDGQPRQGIARLLPNGTVEPLATFDPGAGAVGMFNFAVRCIAVQSDGKILIGGRFTSVDGQPRNYIARLNANGSVEETGTFNPGTGASGSFGNGSVFSIAVQPDGKILLGGQFTSINGLPRNHIARLHSNGTVENTATFDLGTGANTTVLSLAVQTDGKILLGGDFSSVNGRPRGGIARLNSDGSVEDTATFNSGTGASRAFGGGRVLAIAVQTDGKIVFAGDFVNVDGQPRGNIARLNANGSVESTATFNTGIGTAGPFGNGDVFSVALQSDGKILLAGEFSSINGQPPGKIARLNADVSVEGAPAFDPGTVARNVSRGILNGLAVQPDGKILVSGQFSSVNGQPRGNIARLNADGSIDGSFTGSGAGADSPIFCVAVQTDGKILIGGQFVNAGGQPRNYLARLNADGSVESTATFADSIAAPAQVNCIALQPDRKILIGGNFEMAGGQPRKGIARLNEDGTLDAAFDPGGGVTYSIGPNDGYPGRVYSIAVQPDGKILVGGDFTKVDGQPRDNIARLLANGSVEGTATFNPGSVGGTFDGLVNAITLQRDGKILIAGQFNIVGGQVRGNFARLNMNGTLDNTFDPTGTNSGSYISSVALQADGHIVIGGIFSSAGGQPCGNIARLNPNGVGESPAGFDPQGGTDDVINAIALQTDGKILLGGQFTSAGGQPHRSIARLKNDPANQTLVVLNNTYATWLRSGTTAEVSDVSFELSTDGGIIWTPLGAATRIPGGWDRTGMSLPSTGSIRARGRTNGGEHNGSAGLVEQIAAFSLPVPSPPSAYREWSLVHFDQPGAPELGDPDGDGITTLIEYALNLQPRTPDAAPFELSRETYADGERLRIFIQRNPAHDDVTIEVDAADNPAGPWTPIAVSAFGAPFSGDGYVGGDNSTPGIRTVEIRDIVNIADAPRRFLRVHVTK